MRYLVPIACVLLAVACGGGQASSPSGSPPQQATPSPAPATATPSVTPSATPSPVPTVPPTLDLASSFPQQGGFLIARLLDPPPGLGQATVSFAGGSYPMLPEGDRWYAVVGLGTGFAPGEYTLEAVSDEGALASAGVSVAAGGFAQESIELPPESVGLLSDAAAIEAENRTLAQAYAGFTSERLWSGAWIMPAAGPITDPFGLQRSTNGGPFIPHTGTDIAAEAGSPVVAAASGRVAFAGPLHLRGNSVIIDHGAGVFSGYHHMQSIAVSQGQPVTVGDLVGYVGATGFVSGPHLHWEAILHGVRVDPTLWTYRPVEP